MTPLIFIDRRKATHAKSAPNRGRLLKRVREFIKTSNPKHIGSSVGGTGLASPVRIAKSALDEPTICYARGGDRILVLNGNEEYDRGDELPLTDEDASQPGTGGDDSEDEFIINVAKDEFLDLFFEDCELPFLDKENLQLNREELKDQPAGFGINGSPNQLSIIRSYKQSLGRRIALKLPMLNEIAELEKLLEDEQDEEVRAELEAKLASLRTRVELVPKFDKVDLRYKKTEPIETRSVEAVYIMIMDISGSMGQHEKTIARRWFSLNYAFMKRRYKSTELIFIAHTETAFEMTEDDFFSTRVNGGTKVSPALVLANSIIRERYDPERTNIYVSHASDGDNAWDDGDDTIKQAKQLLARCQFFTYLQCGRQYANSWNQSQSELWTAYEDIASKHAKLITVNDPNDIYQAFKKVFKRG